MDAAQGDAVLDTRPVDASTSKLTGLPAMAEVVKQYDKQKVKDCKEDLDTLLVFAGLFSAVLSSFLVATYPSLQQPDSDDRMLAVLERIASQTASYRLVGGYLNSTADPSLTALPGPTITDIRVNALWFASLIISLSTASFAMLVKQWLREFLDIEGPIPQARLRVRHFRYNRIATWKVYEIAAVLPLLLQVALGLFFIGLCFFTLTVHPTIERTTVPLVAGWAFCFLTSTFLPILFPRCPYKTALLRNLVHYLLDIVYPRLSAAADSARRGAWAQYWSADSGSVREYFWKLLMGFFSQLHDYYEIIDEGRVGKTTDSDMQILAAVDSIQSNDVLLRTAIQEWIVHMKPPLSETLDLIRHLLETRLQWTPVKSLQNWKPVIFDPRPLHSDASGSILAILNQAIAQGGHEVWANWRVDDKEGILAFMTITSLSVSQPLPAPTKTFTVMALEHHGPELCRNVAKYTTFDTLNPEDTDVLFEGLTSLVNQLDTTVTHIAWLRCFEAIIDTRLGRSAFPLPSTPFNGWACDDVLSIEWDNIFSAQDQSGVKYLLAVIRSAAKAAIQPSLPDPGLSQPLLIALMIALCACSRFEWVDHSLKEDFGMIWSMALGARRSAHTVIDIWLKVPFDWIRSHPLLVVNNLYGHTLLDDPLLQEKEMNLLAALREHSEAISSILDDVPARRNQSTMVAFLSMALKLCCIAVRLVYMPSATQDAYRDQWTTIFEHMFICHLTDDEELLSLYNLLDEDTKTLVAKCLDSMQLLETSYHLWDPDRESLNFLSWRDKFNPADTVFPNRLFQVLAKMYTRYKPWRLRYLAMQGASPELTVGVPGDSKSESRAESRAGRSKERRWSDAFNLGRKIPRTKSFENVQYHASHRDRRPPRRVMSVEAAVRRPYDPNGTTGNNHYAGQVSIHKLLDTALL